MKKINLVLYCALSLTLCNSSIYATKKAKSFISEKLGKKSPRSIKKKPTQETAGVLLQKKMERILIIAFGDLTPRSIFGEENN